jgi:type VII secretion ATPase EccA
MTITDTGARERLQDAFGAIESGNFSQAEYYLRFAAKKWPDQCDLHRTLTLAQTRLQNRNAAGDEIAAIRNTLNTYDELITSLRSGLAESEPTLCWDLPLIPIPFNLVTRGQIRAAHAGGLIEEGRYDDARDELDAARREPVTRPTNNAVNAVVIDVVECLLHFRTARWNDLLEAAAPLVTAGVNDDAGVKEWSTAIGNAFSGVALAHLGRHEAGQQRLISAVDSRLPQIAPRAALQLGLSHRATGDEGEAQRVFAIGLQHAAMPELMDASRRVDITIRTSTPELIAARTSFWDPATEPDAAEFHHQTSQGERDELLKDARAQLEALDGMDNVKRQVQILAAELAHAAELKRRGVTATTKSRHMVFKGPPGTGKTTVARIIAQIFYAMGLIPRNYLEETSSADFVANYVGQSATLTQETFAKAVGGVLFIDEAYALHIDSSSNDQTFGKEAITELLRLMENHRDDIVVILAGYADKMDDFMRVNPGFRSRVPHEMYFDTYSADQMWRIFTGMAESESYSVDPAVEDVFKKVAADMHSENSKGIRILDEAGNARFARNVFEQAQGLASVRLFSADLSAVSTADLLSLTAEDITGAMAGILDNYGLQGVIDAMAAYRPAAGLT